MTTTRRPVGIGWRMGWLIFVPMLLIALTLTAIDDLPLFALIALVVAWATFALAVFAARS